MGLLESEVGGAVGVGEADKGSMGLLESEIGGAVGVGEADKGSTGLLESVRLTRGR